MFRKASLLALLFCLSTANANTRCKRRLQSMFDLQGIAKQLNMTVAKHLNANMDSEFKEQNALVVQRVEEQIPLVIQGAQTQQAAGSIALTGKGLVGDVHIGGKQFRMRFDTGSADVWVTSTLCTSGICEHKAKYDASKSPTQDPPNGELKYADGSSVSGEIKIDTVNVAGVEASGQFLIAAATLSEQFAKKQYDGMIGMAMSRSRSGLNKDPFFITATKQQKSIDQVFAFKLNEPAFLYLGGTDKSLYTGEIERHTLGDSGPLWKLDGASVSVGTEKAVSGLRTIIDTGSDIILAPLSEVAQFYTKFPGFEMCEESGFQFYYFPCPPEVPVPPVSFGWPSGRSWPISKENFVRETAIDPDGIWCLGNVAGRDFGAGEKVWLLGDPFLKGVYTIFFLMDDEIGFAELK